VHSCVEFAGVEFQGIPEMFLGLFWTLAHEVALAEGKLDPCTLTIQALGVHELAQGECLATVPEMIDTNFKLCPRLRSEIRLRR